MKIPSLDATAAELHATLARTSRRTATVASNLANVDTPGYRALDVDFSDLVPMRSGELRATAPGHRNGSGARAVIGKVVEAPVTRVRGDGNTVDVDREMTLLAMLQGRYRASAEMLRKRYALWLYAVTDGRNGR